MTVHWFPVSFTVFRGVSGKFLGSDDMSVGFGDRVTYGIPGYGADLGYAGEGVIIGSHARYPEIVCVATEQTIGMTLAASHCEKVGDAKDEATRLWERYDARFPGFLTKPD